ncbi:MAG: hypothetical protein AB1Z98_03375 [Nannocystaceae bacterium]
MPLALLTALAILASGCGGCHDTCDVIVTSSLVCVTATPTVAAGFKPGCDAEPRVDVANACAEPMTLDGREVEPGESIQIDLGAHSGVVGADELLIESDLECE